LTKFVQNRL